MARDGFSLDAIREGVGKRTEELNREAEPQSIEDDRPDRTRPFSFEYTDYDRTEAPKDEMRKYWRQFETTPIIRKPIDSFAARVTEPGYYIEARDLEREEIKELGEWLKKSSIIEGMPGRDFRLLAKKAIVQREVRGTALVEKAPHIDNPDQIAGLKLINPEVCEAVTRPQQNILLDRDDGERFPDAPDAESGGKAAWLQDVVEAREVDWGISDRIRKGLEDADDDLKIGFARDEIIPLARDADVGEVFGTSRIEAVSPRIDGIKQKLDDNDKAIQSKAYPLWLFMFGDPETTGVWDSDMIDEFMSAHEMENFNPGMKQGVRGDVSVETISGEVAEIGEYLNFDIQWIMSSMPMPMFSLGSFSERGASVGQVAGVAQQQNVNRQIKEARRELEEEFTPVVRQVAEQKGIDEERAESIELRLGNPNQPDTEVKRSQQVIRYESDAGGGGGQGQVSEPEQQVISSRDGSDTPGPDHSPEQGDPTLDPTSAPGTVGKGETPSSIANPTPDQPIAGTDEDANPFTDTAVNSEYAHVWDAKRSTAELTGDRSTQELSNKVFRVLQDVRDETLQHVSNSYENAPQFAAVEFENVANSKLNSAIRNARLKKKSKDSLGEVVRDVERDYGNASSAFSQSQNVRFFAQTFENAVRDAAEEMLRRARVQVRDGVVNGEQWPDVRQRVEDTYSDTDLQNRANLIAHMETKRAQETTKLQQFEAADNIVGVRVSNPDATARVTKQLHGAEAYFEQGEIDNQLAEGVREDALREGFNPLPRTPPYHFNDTTTLEPVYRDEQ